MVVLYRKYRPQKLSDLVGQEHIKKPLLEAFKNGRISHAYLFTGPKGTGKTTTARILAKMLNCERSVRLEMRGGNEKKNPASHLPPPTSFGEPCNKCDTCQAISNGSFLDVLEIDAASNRLIEDVRDLREKVRLLPTSGRFKVYILDEVHMLTPEAFNALLKTLEEPPTHVVFILCTTTPHKLPATIISRCQRFDFKKAKKEEIVSYLSFIAKKENIDIDKKALSLIAQESSGGFRDAVSLFDQIVSGKDKKKIEERDIQSLILLSEERLNTEFSQLLKEKDAARLLAFLTNLESQNVNPSLFLRNFLLYLQKQLLVKMGLEEKVDEIHWETEQIKKLVELFIKAEPEVKISSLPLLPLEMVVLEWCGDEAESRKQRGESREDENHQTKNPDVKVTLEDLKNSWSEILKALVPHNHSVVALLRSCQPHDFQGQVLTIATYYKFHRDRLLDERVKSLIEQVLKELFQTNIKISCQLLEKPIPKAEVKEDLVEVAEEIFK